MALSLPVAYNGRASSVRPEPTKALYFVADGTGGHVFADTLALLNAGVPLPDAAISPVRRADGSGTSFIFTNYLSKANADWLRRLACKFAISRAAAIPLPETSPMINPSRCGPRFRKSK